MNALRQKYIDQPKMPLPLPPFYSDRDAGQLTQSTGRTDSAPDTVSNRS